MSKIQCRVIEDRIKYTANYNGRCYSKLDECKVPRSVEFSARRAKLREDKTQMTVRAVEAVCLILSISLI